jgi:hypothetical protein
VPLRDVLVLAQQAELSPGGRTGGGEAAEETGKHHPMGLTTNGPEGT